MYYPGYPSYPYYGYNENNGTNWLWIIIKVAIIFFLFWGFAGNRGCKNTCGSYK